jgi:SAM-dependent methyltransferase
VLEVGAGRGELAAELRAAGFDVVAIDPAADADGVLPVALADLDEPPASFDAALAVVSLHHVEPLVESLRRLAELVRPGGRLVVDEFDVERFDERAAAWLNEQWRALGHERHEHHTADWIGGLRAELHTITAIRSALAPRFDLGPVARGGYLHRWELDGSLRATEDELIARGELPATGVRFTGTRR